MSGRLARHWDAVARFAGPRGWSAEEQAAWELESRPMDARNGTRIFLALGVANLLWWPLDGWVLADDVVVQAMFASRRPWVTPLLVGLAALPLVPGIGARPLGAFGFFGGLSYGWLCWAFGAAGGPSTPWIHLAPLLSAPSIGLAARPLHRFVFLAWLFGCGITGFFVPHPAYAGDPAARLVLSYAAFAALVCFVGGIITDGLRRSNFRLRSRLGDRATELDALNGALSHRVEAQTAALTALTGELRSLLAHTEQAREAERAHLSRELHDELGQELTGLRFALELTRRRYVREPTGVAHNLEQLDELLTHTARAARALVRDLRPALLDDLQLLDALRWLVDRAGERGGPPVELVVEGDPAAVGAVGPGAVAVVAFRAAQEALTNVARHAGASRSRLIVGVDAGSLVLMVDDDGRGFEPAQREGATTGFGLVGIRERARSVGGALSVGRGPLGGARVALRLPIHTPGG